MILRTLAAVWQYLRDASMPVRAALFLVVVMSAVFFILGGFFHPQKNVRQLLAELEDRQEDIRGYAEKSLRQDEQIGALRAQNALREKTISQLKRLLDSLHSQNIEAREETLFYRQLFDSEITEKEFSIYALDVAPGFTPQQWEFNAILVRTGKKKTFSGGYYFDVLHEGKGGENITRFPAAEKTFKMGFYYEIAENFTLPGGEEIKNIRLAVVNGKKEIVAAAELLEGGE